MANINVEKLKEKLYPTASALFCISEVCVDVSKQHISAEDAIEKIHGYLGKTDMYSRHSVDCIIADCAMDEYMFTFTETSLQNLPRADAKRIKEAVNNTTIYKKKVL